MNKVMLIGRVGGEPRVRTTASGQQVASFRLATSERWIEPSPHRSSNGMASRMPFPCLPSIAMPIIRRPSRMSAWRFDVGTPTPIHRASLAPSCR